MRLGLFNKMRLIVLMALVLSMLSGISCYAQEMERGYFEGDIPQIIVLPDAYVSQNFIIKGRQVSVSFNMLGGYMPDNQFVVGDAKADNKSLKLRQPVKDGCSYYGWYYEKNGKYIRVRALNKKLFKDTDHVVLTARYSSLKYNLVFKKTNPEPGVKAEGKNIKLKNVTYSEKIKLGNLFTAPGYRVIGWSREKNNQRVDAGLEVGSVVSGLSGRAKKDPKRVVFYPVWERVSTESINTGGYATLKLSSNPSTGYGWEIEQSEELLDIKSEMRRLAPPDIVGAAEEEIITFTPVKAGEVKVTLRYRRSWEDKPANQTLVYTFKIDENLRIALLEKAGYDSNGKSMSNVPDVEVAYYK